MRRLYIMMAGVTLWMTEQVCQAAEHGGEEPPGLFSGSIWTSIWTLVIFLLLLMVLGRFAWKPILQALKNREDRIREDLQTAKMDREQAEKVLADYKQQLAKSQAQAEELLKQASVQAERAREEILTHGQEQARAMVEQAKQQIDQAKVQALKDLYAKSAELAGDLASKILQREVNTEDHRILIQQGLDKLEKKN